DLGALARQLRAWAPSLCRHASSPARIACGDRGIPEGRSPIPYRPGRRHCFHVGADHSAGNASPGLVRQMIVVRPLAATDGRFEFPSFVVVAVAARIIMTTQF